MSHDSRAKKLERRRGVDARKYTDYSLYLTPAEMAAEYREFLATLETLTDETPDFVRPSGMVKRPLSVRASIEQDAARRAPTYDAPAEFYEFRRVLHNDET